MGNTYGVFAKTNVYRLWNKKIVGGNSGIHSYGILSYKWFLLTWRDCKLYYFCQHTCYGVLWRNKGDIGNAEAKNKGGLQKIK